MKSGRQKREEIKANGRGARCEVPARVLRRVEHNSSLYPRPFGAKAEAPTDLPTAVFRSSTGRSQDSIEHGGADRRPTLLTLCRLDARRTIAAPSPLTSEGRGPG
jgi:hypothetical protein